MFTLLHIVSYAAAAAAFAFVILSLASGLLWLAEIIEEHSRMAKIIGKRIIHCVITFHVLVYVIDRNLPLSHILFSIACHLIYLLNFRTFPVISLTSWSFMASVLLVVADHFLWFFHFSYVVEEARKRERRWRHPKDPGVHVPNFSDIATFFGICVWLVPLFLFLSLTANENALPTIQGTSSSSSRLEIKKKQRQSLFVSLSSQFTSAISGRIPRSHLRKDSDGLIAPRSISRPSSPVPPESNLLSPVYQAPPPSPGALPGLPRSPRQSPAGSPTTSTFGTESWIPIENSIETRHENYLGESRSSTDSRSMRRISLRPPPNPSRSSTTKL